MEVFSKDIKALKLPAGPVVIVEEMPHLTSVAFSILLPVGAISDPEGEEGTNLLLVDLLQRGAGTYDTRALSEAFDNIGIHKSQSPGIEATVFSGMGLGENLGAGLRLVKTMITEPWLPESELDSVRALALQDLRSLEDEPASKVMVELAARLYPHPYGRSNYGTEAGLKSVTVDSLRSFHQKFYRGSNVIIGVAGRVNAEDVFREAQEIFSGWSGEAPAPAPCSSLEKAGSWFKAQDTSQLQIALAFPSVSIDHPDYYSAKVLEGILSGGMSGRLFIEVREKRGLVYRVSASHSAIRGRAAFIAYAGTTPENGQETLDVMLDVIRHSSEGISSDELERAKIDLKSRLIMRGESSSSRASALVSDYYNLSRVRTLDEIKAGVDAVTAENIAHYLSSCPPHPVTLMTLGKKRLEITN
ncbi:MAG: pitrilysin family protein [bacterium]|nr:pitrilysin family protein [bacterium]